MFFSALDSVLANDHPDYEVVLVDQSTDGITKSSIDKYIKDYNLNYIKSDETGYSRAKNLGISHCNSEYIAIVDDDCVVPANWLSSMEEAFGVDGKIGLVFGNVKAGEYDKNLGFIPTYIRDEPYLADSIYKKNNVEGISACMGLRKSLWEKLGGFDNMLGVGAYFGAAEETDLCIRALIQGYKVYETPKISVIHNGFRNWEESSELIKSYWYGTGAMFAKHIKCGHIQIFYILAGLAIRWVFGVSTVIAMLGIKKYRISRLISFVNGLLNGMAIPVDSSKGHFINRS